MQIATTQARRFHNAVSPGHSALGQHFSDSFVADFAVEDPAGPGRVADDQRHGDGDPYQHEHLALLRWGCVPDRQAGGTTYGHMVTPRPAGAQVKRTRKSASYMLTDRNAKSPAVSSGAIFYRVFSVMVVAGVGFEPTTFRL